MKIKRWIGVLLCMLLCIGMLPTMAFAANVTSIQVNGTDILSAENNTVPCGSGSAVYDPATNTLTLNNAEITSTASGNTEGAISFDNGDLKIVLVGENTITSSCHGIIGQGGTLTIIGEGSLNVTSVYGGITEGQKGNIIIDGTKLELNVSNSGGFSGTGIHAEGQLSILNGSSVNALGETADTMGIIGNAGITISDSSVTAKVLSEGSYGAIVSDSDIIIENSYVEASTSSVWEDSTIWAINLTISKDSEVYADSVSGNALYVDNQLIVNDSIVNATAPGDYPAIYTYGDIAIQNGSDVTGSGNFRGIFTDSSITVNDSTVTASGATNEGIIAVDTFSIDNSKVTASSKLDDIIPAIVTYNLNITASEVTAKGGIQLWDFYSGDTTGRTFSLTPAEGKLAEFKVDATNWDGSGASHFKEGAKSPYDAAVTFNESEMNWLDAYRYIHIGEHIHRGGMATCTEKAVCADCGKTYGDLNPNNHSGEVVWTKTATDHTSTYDCCGATVVAKEAHEWENGVCSECGYEWQHDGGTATCSQLAVCDTCGEEYGEVNASNHTNLVKTEAKPATHMTEGNIEYWYCDGCEKYFSDEAGTKEIALADTVVPKLTGHTADGTGWHSDETNHWNTCECGEKLNEAAHTLEWVIDKEATATEKGSKHEKCTVCGYEKAAVEIPATGTPSDTHTPSGNQTGDSISPQTGDDSNIALWIALLLAAGAALTGTAVYRRKRKYNR